MVEQRTHNSLVEGSSPSPRTIRKVNFNGCIMALGNNSTQGFDSPHPHQILWGCPGFDWVVKGMPATRFEKTLKFQRNINANDRIFALMPGLVI